MNVAYDTAPLVLDNAGTARYVRGVLDALGQRSDVRVQELTWGGSGRATAVVRDAAWYPSSCRCKPAAPTFCIARRSARRCVHLSR